MLNTRIARATMLSRGMRLGGLQRTIKLFPRWQSAQPEKARFAFGWLARAPPSERFCSDRGRTSGHCTSKSRTAPAGVCCRRGGRRSGDQSFAVVVIQSRHRVMLSLIQPELLSLALGFILLMAGMLAAAPE
jgi:hypothetical protein